MHLYQLQSLKAKLKQFEFTIRSAAQAKVKQLLLLIEQVKVEPILYTIETCARGNGVEMATQSKHNYQEYILVWEAPPPVKYDEIIILQVITT